MTHPSLVHHHLWLHLWLWYWHSLSSSLSIMIVYVILNHKVIRTRSIEFFSLSWIDFFDGIYHVFTHIFISVLLKNQSWNLLFFILNRMNKMTEISSRTSLHSMIILARNRPVITNFNLNFFSFFLKSLNFFSLLRFLIKIFKLLNLSPDSLNVLLVFKTNLYYRQIFKLLLINKIVDVLFKLTCLVFC